MTERRFVTLATAGTVKAPDETGRNSMVVESAVYEKKQIKLNNDPSLIDGVVNRLLDSASSRMSPLRKREVAIALYEIILNAMEHGNLELTSAEKNRRIKAGNYLDFLEKMESNPKFGGRRVEINYSLDAKRMHFCIADEGPGFDWKSMKIGVIDENALLSPHGRGLTLAAHYADNLEFNAKGNVVYLTMLAPKQPLI